MPVYPDEPKIPILPNLLTAGNLLCGFFSILTIFKGMAYPDGSLEAFADAQGGSSFCRCTAPSAGYFLLIAKKPC